MTETLRAPMAGTVVDVPVAPGDVVGAGTPLVVLESMKLEHPVVAPRSGRVAAVTVRPGEVVDRDAPLVELELLDDTPASSEPDRPDHDLRLLAEVEARHRRVLDESRPEAVAARHDRGAHTARELVAALVDPGSFREYGPLVVAAQRARRTLDELVDRTPADGLVAGVGTVDADRYPEATTVVMAYDYTVLAGTQGVQNHRKTDRLLELAHRRRYPVVLFAEGGGGRPGDTDTIGKAGLDVPTFAAFARLSGRVPLVAVVDGYCFAGNAVLAAMCDVVVATRRSHLGAGGPAMIEGGGLGQIAPDAIGPAAVQEANGVVDVLVDDDLAAVEVARRYLGYFRGRHPTWEASDQASLRSAVPGTRRRSYDVRRIVEILCDVDSTLELRPRFGRSVVTILGRIEGRPIGVLANDPRHLGGALDAPASEKAARFLRLCDAFGLPVVSLVDTPGIMVGPDAERAGTLRHAARTFLAGANLTVPVIAVVLRRGYGLGAMAMVGGGFKETDATVAWPTGEIGPMGLEGAVRLGYRRELEAIDDPVERERRYAELLAEAYEQGKALTAATWFDLDDVIDPAETRSWVASLLATQPDRPHWGRSGSVDAW